jgi:hypothetical protein
LAPMVGLFFFFWLSIAVLVVDMDTSIRLTVPADDSFVSFNLVERGQVKFMCGFDVGGK